MYLIQTEIRLEYQPLEAHVRMHFQASLLWCRDVCEILSFLQCAVYPTQASRRPSQDQ